jgi:Kef-type K+ transport system membrane component KefB
VKQASAVVSIAALVAFAAYSIFVVIVALSGEGHGPVFWASIVVIVLMAGAALWGARWLFRRRLQSQ